MSKSRFVLKLLEALVALEISGAAYDRGVECEAIRLAGTLRVLFHRTGRSVPLIDHLGMDKWDILSSDGKHNDPKSFVSFRIDLNSMTPMRIIPKLGRQFAAITIAKWWQGEAVYRYANNDYYRCDLITTAANKDGASHVDPKLEQFYLDMQSWAGLVINGQSLIYPQNKAPFDQSKPQQGRDVHLAMLRQFAHEVLVSSSHLRWFERLSPD